MKKHLLILLTALLSTTPLLAQYSPCYEAAFAEGKRLYDQGKYTQAKKYFNEAKDCPDPNTVAANEWIGMCNQRINDKKIDAASFNYMKINRMDFCNMELNGQIIDDYGTTFNLSRLKCIQPRITYDGMLNVEKNAVIYVKVFDPNKFLVAGVDWPTGFTYSDSVRIVPGKTKTLLLSKWDNNGLSFSFGTYRFELWVNGNCIHSSSFEVEADRMFVISQFNDEYNSYLQSRIEGAYYYLQGRYDSNLRKVFMSDCKTIMNDIIGQDRQYDTVEKRNTEYVLEQMKFLQQVLCDQEIIKDNYDRIVRNLQDLGCLPDTESLSLAKKMVDRMTSYVKNSNCYHPNLYKKYDEAIALINMELSRKDSNNNVNNPISFEKFIDVLRNKF